MADTAVRFISISVSSSYVRSDARVHVVEATYDIDLEEFAQRHGETFRRFVRFLAVKHKLPRSALSHLVVCFLSEPHNWLRMESADDFLTAVYAAMQDPARRLQTQVYARARVRSSSKLSGTADDGDAASTASSGDADGDNDHGGDGDSASDRGDGVGGGGGGPSSRRGSAASLDVDAVGSVIDDGGSLYDSEGGPGMGSPRHLKRSLSVSSSVQDLVAGLASMSSQASLVPPATARTEAPAAAPSDRSHDQAPAQPDGEYAGVAAPGERVLLTFPVRPLGASGVALTWNNIAVGSAERGGAKVVTLYWADSRQGLVGSYDPASGRILTLVDDLVIPTRVQVVEHRLYIVEEGGVWRHDGRLSFFDLNTGQHTTLLTGLDLPHGLHVTERHNVYFMQSATEPPAAYGGASSALYSGAVGSGVAAARRRGYRFSLTPAGGDNAGINVCLLRQEHVASAVPGLNPHLAGKAEVVLHRSPARGGLPQDLVVLPNSGQLLIGFRTPGGGRPGSARRGSGSLLTRRSSRGSVGGASFDGAFGGDDAGGDDSSSGTPTSARSRDAGFIEQYVRQRDGTTFDDTHGLVVMRRRPAIMGFHLDVKRSAVHCCGFGGPQETASVALSRARASTPQDFVVLRQGAALSVATDDAQNVYFVCGTGRGGKLDLRMLPSKAQLRAAARAEQIVHSYVPRHPGEA